jgi:hypothetical protein
MKFFAIILSFLLISTISAQKIDTKDINFLKVVAKEIEFRSENTLREFKPYLRSVEPKCVLDRLNLIQTEEFTHEELLKFNVDVAFPKMALDLHVLLLTIKVSCVKDQRGYNKMVYDRMVNNPILKFTQDQIECGENWLVKMGREKPLIDHFDGLKKHNESECNSFINIPRDLGSDKKCAGIFREFEDEFVVKFALMHVKRPSDAIYDEEFENFLNTTIAMETYIDCKIEELF